jgi:hypothetical protein
MTIDEMITHLEYSDIKLDAETQIIAALRAGQGMRGILHLIEDPRDYKQEAAAWDAATGGEK